MSPADDPTSIGSILVAMGVITAEQLEIAVREQHTVRVDVLLGKLLLANGVISPHQLEVALQSQNDLRSKKKHKRAMAQSKIAEQSVGAVIALASKLRKSARETREKVTGTDYPAITAEMLSGKSEH